MNTRTIIIWGLTLLLIISFGVYLYIESKNSTEVIPEGIDAEVDMSPDDLVNEIPVSNIPDMPSLTRSVDEFSPTDDMRKSIQNTVATLRKTPGSFDDWILLGIYRKQIGDYDGALEAWQFASKIRPDDAVPKNNIGMLYYLHLKEYAKAEEILLATTKTNPTYVPTYQNLYELYHYAYKMGKGLDEQILLTGIEKNQKDMVLTMLLGSFYEEAGRKAEAKKTYTKAPAIAKEQNDEGLIAYIEELLASL